MVDSFSAFGGTFGLPTFWYVIWMTEKNLVDMAVRYLQNDWKFNGDLIFWRAPAFRKLRWDIFNCFDLVVIKRNKTDSFLDNPTTDIFFYQITTSPNLAARRKKIQAYFRDKEFVIPNSYVLAWHEKRGVFSEEKVDDYV